MTPELRHKLIEHLIQVETLLGEVIDDNDPVAVAREEAARKRNKQLMEEVENETRTVQQQGAATPAGGDGK